MFKRCIRKEESDTYTFYKQLFNLVKKEYDINNYNLFKLIHNLQHNYNTKYIVLDELFLNNINYIEKTNYFEDILQYILTNHKESFFNNFNKFLNIIANNEKYMSICQDNNILLMSKEEITGFGDYKFVKVKKYYKEKFNNYTIIWF
jgi:hypothetical protein